MKPSRLPQLADISLYDRSIAFLVICFLYSCYLLTYTGVMQSSDGLSMFATAESIVRRGEVDTNQLLWMGLQQGSFGPDGDLYSRKGPGMTLLALPFIWLARQWSALGLVQAALLLNPLLTAWTAGLLYRAVVRLAWSRFIAVVTALAFGLATLAWPYTQTFFSDPVAAWGLFGAFYGILAFSQSRRKRYLFLGGLAWGIAYLARSINLITLPVYVLALAAVISDWGLVTGDKEFKRVARFPITSPQSLITNHLREWIIFALPIFIAGIVSLWWNWLRYGSVWETGYVESESFSANWFFGLYGLLIGPARGILWYSPVILLAGLGIVPLWRSARWLLLTCLGIALIYLVLYAKWYMWHGGYSWGPRFLVPALPFVMLITAPAWHQIYDAQRWDGWGRIGASLLLILSLSVQWLGLLIPFSLVQNWLEEAVTPLFAPITFTEWGYSPLFLQWRFLAEENLHFAWWRVGEDGPDWLALGLVLGALLVGGWLLARQVQSAQDQGELIPTWVYGAALLLVTLGLLVRYQSPLSGATTLEIAQQIELYEEVDDAILFLRPLESQQFANAYHGTLPVYGLFPVDALDADAAARLADLSQRYRRLWVIPDFALPDRSGWERTLRGSAFLLLDETFGIDTRRLALYALPHAQPLTETGSGVQFGAPAWVRLNSYGYTQSRAPGEELLIALEWESLQPVDKNYQVFVHLLDEGGQRLAQRDGQPVLWLRPTSTWQSGERILDRYGLLLPLDFPVGDYRLSVGLYDPATGERQPVSVGPSAAVELGPIRVEANSR
ncbi:MAG: hypothetical protein KF893_24030 [Caldilineaceae bacterium]|nr:hypothetical protein [Caldilineaceae bacterium]